ncbi:MULTISPECIES: hypothetical protein [unclassified Lentimicrobium]|uniref:DUF6913 domain-containing protein n=1 Tax=unclassified Lentimicrobium TaxID=2677434 RepID=UPI001553D474|nr:MULTISPECIES: hypothetical protein [unclassified Lentimicrobium]NPD47117.1 hypothetical protein [Lentimicrobium sp. S6]NPD83758.1 hypothetical protein [Lentimicrobium sp. L6]
MGIIAFLQDRKIRNTDIKNPRRKVFMPLSDIHSILVLASLSNIDEREKWKTHFKNLSKNKVNIDFLCFVNSKSEDKENNVDLDQVIFPSHLSFLGNIKMTESVSAIIDKKYDLLIDLNFDELNILNYLIVKVNTSLRVGGDFNKKMDSYLDLKIKTDEPRLKPKLFIDQVFYYLGKININGNK